MHTVHRPALVPRVDTAEGDQHIIVADRTRDEVLDRVGRVAHRGPRVDREHHRGGIVRSIQVGDRVDPAIAPGGMLKYFAVASTSSST